uniref:Uncharacterized protein n=1 Tax=Oryza meridionalis TaxID=40149 RepID=A0A0E0DDF8_9ORYZ
MLFLSSHCCFLNFEVHRASFPHQIKLFRSELAGVCNSILKSVPRDLTFGISTGETDIMGTAKNPIGFRCNKCMKKDSSLHDQNQHMSNVPTDLSTCLKESSDNVHGATNRLENLKGSEST